METIAVVDKLLARGQKDGYFSICGHGMLNFLQKYENIYKVQNLQGIVDDFICIFLKMNKKEKESMESKRIFTNLFVR